MNDDDLYIPTPEEVDEDRPASRREARRQRREADTGDDGGRPRRRLLPFRQGAVVRRSEGPRRGATAPHRRRDEESREEPPQPPVPDEPEAPDPPRPESAPPAPGADGPPRLRRLSVPQTRRERPQVESTAPPVPAHASGAARRAAENGHQLRSWTETPDGANTEYTATCRSCGMEARTVFEVPDNWSESAGYPRDKGRAVNLACPNPDAQS